MMELEGPDLLKIFILIKFSLNWTLGNLDNIWTKFLNNLGLK